MPDQATIQENYDRILKYADQMERGYRSVGSVNPYDTFLEKKVRVYAEVYKKFAEARTPDGGIDQAKLQEAQLYEAKMKAELSEEEVRTQSNNPLNWPNMNKNYGAETEKIHAKYQEETAKILGMRDTNDNGNTLKYGDKGWWDQMNKGIKKAIETGNTSSLPSDIRSQIPNQQGNQQAGPDANFWASPFYGSYSTISDGNGNVLSHSPLPGEPGWNWYESEK